MYFVCVRMFEWQDKERYARELAEYKTWLVQTQGSSKEAGPPDQKKLRQQKQQPNPDVSLSSSVQSSEDKEPAKMPKQEELPASCRAIPESTTSPTEGTAHAKLEVLATVSNPPHCGV